MAYYIVRLARWTGSAKKVLVSFGHKSTRKNYDEHRFGAATYPDVIGALEHYMETIFRKLEIEKDTEKYHQIFDELRNYGTIAA